MVTMIAWFPFQCNCAKLVCVWERGRLRFAVQAHHWLGSGGFCFVALWEPGTIIGGHPAWACLPVQARRDRRAPADQWGCSARLIRDWVRCVMSRPRETVCSVCFSISVNASGTVSISLLRMLTSFYFSIWKLAHLTWLSNYFFTLICVNI